jgi:prevent-host-death family protein
MLTLETVNIHKAKTHLSSLLERVSRGEEIMIAKAGKPIARLMPLDEAPAQKIQRIGFMKDLAEIPDDFDTMFQDEIIAMFEGDA